MQTKFQRDLERGRFFEQLMTPYIVPDTIVAYAPDKCWWHWDLSGVKYTYEVKADFLAYSTGNLFIETECNNKPSGFNHTEAEYFLYVVVKPNGTKFGGIHRVFKIPTLDLVALCIGKRSVWGGDRGLVKGNLLPITEIMEYEVCLPK